MIIDVAVSEDRKMIKKEGEKSLKFTDLTIEIQHVAYKRKVIPVITGATGTIPQSDNSSATHQESVKSRNYKKRPYWPLHTYLRMY